MIWSLTQNQKRVSNFHLHKTCGYCMKWKKSGPFYGIQLSTFTKEPILRPWFGPRWPKILVLSCQVRDNNVGTYCSHNPSVFRLLSNKCVKYLATQPALWRLWCSLVDTFLSSNIVLITFIEKKIYQIISLIAYLYKVPFISTLTCDISRDPLKQLRQKGYGALPVFFGERSSASPKHCAPEILCDKNPEAKQKMLLIILFRS